MDDRLIIGTRLELCEGCNKCLSKCPVNANNAKITDNRNTVLVDRQRCIYCGECVTVCDHHARLYDDDTERFFARLKEGAKISLLVAPSIRHSLPSYKRLFGYLKSLGVNLIMDVSFGADIATWAYLRTLEAGGRSTMIAQPCPVVVFYIQKHMPELIPYLAPIQSPTLCAAIYIRNYMKVGDELAFLSPCFAKEREFNDPNTGGLVTYNVTVEKLKAYLKSQGVRLESYPEAEFDRRSGDLGFTFSRPGGLRENVEFYAGDKVWVKQVEGTEDMVQYLDQYAQRIRQNKPTPAIVDILNCRQGCNMGTGIGGPPQTDDVDRRINEQKKTFMQKGGRKPEAILREMDESLKLADFARRYTDQSESVRQEAITDLNSVYEQLGKTTEISRRTNCYACGYGSCEAFATAVMNGGNDVRNCVEFSRHKLKSGRQEFGNLFQGLDQQLEEMNHKLEALRGSGANLNNISMQTRVISINASIESARAGQYGRAFGVVASEIRNLANKSGEIIQHNQASQESLMADILELERSLRSIHAQMDEALQ